MENRHDTSGYYTVFRDKDVRGHAQS